MPAFTYRSGCLSLGERTAVMGILNVTPDSFSDGGRYTTVEAALEHACRMEREGADLLDIGAQSTRPGHVPVSAEEEIRRLQPVLRALRPRTSLPLSIDTYYPEVARMAMEEGADILNDVSGGIDNGMAEMAAATGAGLIMMHAGGGADDTGDGGDPVEQVAAFFRRALCCARQAGLPEARVCLDPGIGFGKGRTGDGELVARLPRLIREFPHCAVLVGASRKRVTAAFSTAEGENPPPFDQRLGGTVAIHSIAQWHGAHILRVHDVAPAVQAARLVDALRSMREERIG